MLLVQLLHFFKPIAPFFHPSLCASILTLLIPRRYIDPPFHNHPLTRTTFLFPFCIPPPAPGAPGAAPAPAPSVAFIPAFTVSTSTPLLSAGEYGLTLLAKGGKGSGGIGNRRRPVCLPSSVVVEGAVLCFALGVCGCLPLLDLEALDAGVAEGALAAAEGEKAAGVEEVL